MDAVTYYIALYLRYPIALTSLSS